jgi:hypothetical protein
MRLREAPSSAAPTHLSPFKPRFSKALDVSRHLFQGPIDSAGPFSHAASKRDFAATRGLCGQKTHPHLLLAARRIKGERRRGARIHQVKLRKEKALVLLVRT